MGIERYFRSEALEKYRRDLDDPELIGSNFSRGTKIMVWSLLLVFMVFFVGIYGLYQRSRKVHYVCEGEIAHIQLAAKGVSRAVAVRNGKSVPMLLTEDRTGGGYVAVDPVGFLCVQRQGEIQLILN